MQCGVVHKGFVCRFRDTRHMCAWLQPSAGAAALSAQLSDDGTEILVTLNLPCQLLGNSAACAPARDLY